MSSAGSGSDWLFGAATVATGVGALTFALFPLALPILVLTLVALLPLALPLVAAAALAAILTGAWLALRAAGRGMRRLGGGPRRPGESRATERRSAPERVLRDPAATGPRS